MRSSRAVAAAAVAAALAVAAGAVVALTDPPTGFGWFAYSPLTTAGDLTAVFGNAVLLTRVQAAAAVVAALALAATTGLLGYALGRRRRPSSSASCASEVSGPPR